MFQTGKHQTVEYRRCLCQNFLCFLQRSSCWGPAEVAPWCRSLKPPTATGASGQPPQWKKFTSDSVGVTTRGTQQVLCSEDSAYDDCSCQASKPRWLAQVIGSGKPKRERKSYRWVTEGVRMPVQELSIEPHSRPFTEPRDEWLSRDSMDARGALQAKQRHQPIAVPQISVEWLKQ